MRELLLALSVSGVALAGQTVLPNTSDLNETASHSAGKLSRNPAPATRRFTS
jgi:hypothetical protein